MSKRLLWGIIIVLLVTNIASIMILMNGKDKSIEDLSKQGNVPNEVAKIGDTTISAEDWVKKLRAKYGEMSLEQLINEEVVFRLADKYELSVDEKVMERELAYREIAAGLLSDEERIEEKKKWENSIQYELFLDDLLTQDVVVEDQEIANYYEENESDFDFPTSYQISQIIVEDANVANEVIDQLESGQAFSELAKQYSIDPHTNKNGGYLGCFSADNTYLQGIYFSQLGDMLEGTFSIPFETTEGTVILYLHHVLPEIDVEYNDVKDHIRTLLAKQKLSIVPPPTVLWEEIGVDWIYE